MRWHTLAVEAEMGAEEGLSCLVCGHMQTGCMHFPQDINPRQARWITQLWGNPDCFRVCEACIDGYNGLAGIPGLDADAWLEARVKEHLARPSGNRAAPKSNDPGNSVVVRLRTRGC